MQPICAMRSSSSLVFLAPGLAPTSTGRPVNWWYGPAKLWKQNRRIPQPAGLTGTARHHDFRFSKPPAFSLSATSPSQQNHVSVTAKSNSSFGAGWQQNANWSRNGYGPSNPIATALPDHFFIAAAGTWPIARCRLLIMSGIVLSSTNVRHRKC